MSEFFIRRPIVAIVIAVVTVLVGAVSLLGLPISQFPQIIPPQISLTTSYTGADAQTIEQSVATPIEQQVNGVDGMLYVQSTNANDGTMVQQVTFDVGTNIDIDNVLVQNRFAQAQPLLPQDVKNLGVTIKKSLNLEFAKERLEKGQPLVDAALEGARLRLRPILMTSFAFIFGCLPLCIAEGAGAASRRIMGTVVVTGMLAATLFGIFVVPALFVFVERVAGREKPVAAELPPPRASDESAVA